MLAPRRRPQGFTLIEVMIVVAIVGILAAVALPSYSRYLLRGEQPEAFTQLSTYRITLEQYYQDNRNYGSSTCGEGAIASTPAGTHYFSFSCTLDSGGQGYTLKATGTGTRTTGYDYTVNQNNERYTTKYEGTAYTAEKACWLTKSTSC